MIYFKEDMFEIFGKSKNNQTVILAEANEIWLMHSILKILIKYTRYKKIIVRQSGKNYNRGRNSRKKQNTLVKSAVLSGVMEIYANDI